MTPRFNIAFVMAAALTLAACSDSSRVVGPGGDAQLVGAPAALHIDAISPAEVDAGSPELTVTLTGRGFVSDSAGHLMSEVRWVVDGHSDYLETTPVSDTQIMAKVSANLLSVHAMANVRVETWDIMGDAPQAVSNSVHFAVN